MERAFLMRGSKDPLAEAEHCLAKAAKTLRALETRLVHARTGMRVERPLQELEYYQIERKIAAIGHDLELAWELYREHFTETMKKEL